MDNFYKFVSFYKNKFVFDKKHAYGILPQSG